MSNRRQHVRVLRWKTWYPKPAKKAIIEDEVREQALSEKGQGKSRQLSLEMATPSVNN